MMIDGKSIAQNLLEEIQRKVLPLKAMGITPTLAVILVGDNPASESFVRMKEKAALTIGAQLRMTNYPSTPPRRGGASLRASELQITKEVMKEKIQELNTDSSVHGIIIQRPVPDHLNDLHLLQSIKPEKDVDGFLPHSPFEAPVAKAVVTILHNVYQIRNSNIPLRPLDFEGRVEIRNKYDKENKFETWIQSQKIVLVGRGETAGGPIINNFQLSMINYQLIHSKTENPCEIMRNADIIISCVGKPRVVTRECIKPGAILIGVGMWKDEKGEYHGDYEEQDIKDIASFYTPIPGGVGPVNVAYLMDNLVKAVT